MTETIEPITVETEGVTVSLLVWRRFRRPMPGLVERILDTNPGLAALGDFIPPGTVVNIPVPAAQKQVSDITPVRLWG